jgi:hypothetical protein
MAKAIRKLPRTRFHLHFSLLHCQTMMATLRKEYAAAKASKFEIEAAADAAARSAAAKMVSVSIMYSSSTETSSACIDAHLYL